MGHSPPSATESTRSPCVHGMPVAVARGGIMAAPTTPEQFVSGTPDRLAWSLDSARTLRTRGGRAPMKSALRLPRPALRFSRPALRFSRPALRFSRPALRFLGPTLQFWRPALQALVVALVASMGIPEAAAQRLSDADYEAAIGNLASENSETRLDAVEVLGRRGWRRRREIAPHLRRLLRTDPDWRVRASSGRAIGRLSVRTAVPDLAAALRDPQVEVRVVAAAALWRLPDAAAVPGLITLLNDTDPAARQWAALALGVVRDRRATAPLLRMLTDDQPEVRLDVVRSLGRVGDPAAMSALQAYVENADLPEDERLEAVNAIASLDSPDKVNVLVRLLRHAEEPVRLRAVRALGQVGDALAIPPLRRVRGEARGELRTSIDESIAAIRERARAAREARPD